MLAQRTFSFSSKGPVSRELCVVLLSMCQGTNRDCFLGPKWGEWAMSQVTVKEDSLGIRVVF